MELKGTVRAPVMAWLLCFVPLVNLIWVFYYKYSILTEIKAYLQDEEMSPIMDVLVWPIVTCGLYQFYMPIKMGKLIQRVQVKGGLADAPDQGVMFLLFMFLCNFHFFKYQDELNKVWSA